jgi:hypothetical protein
MKKNYALTRKNEYRVLIAETVDINTAYVVVNMDFDHATMKAGEISYTLLPEPNSSFERYIHNPECYVSRNALDAAMRLLDKMVRENKAKIRAFKKHPAYYAMNAAVEAIVKNFRVDFDYSDALAIFNCPGQKFLWFVRESGTNIVFRQGAWGSVIVDEALKNKHVLAYWNGSELLFVSEDEVIKIYQNMEKK